MPMGKFRRFDPIFHYLFLRADTPRLYPEFISQPKFLVFFETTCPYFYLLTGNRSLHKAIDNPILNFSSRKYSIEREYESL